MSTRDLLQEIQAEAVDGNSDLSTLLRKCVVLSFQLNNPDLKKWAQSELDGYALSTDLPDYRVIKGVPSFGGFLGIAGSALRNAPLSLLGLPEPVRDRFAKPEVREGVRSIAELITANQKEGLLRWHWPPEACEIFNHEGYRADFRLAEAWISVPVSRFVGILDTVRNRVLSFVLEIESILGPDEAPSRKSKETKAAQINQTFHQTIYGPVSNVGTADSISQTMIVAAGDLEGLKARLQEKGFPESDLQELEKVIKADEAGPKPTEQHFGKNVANCLGNIVKKAGTGALKLGTDVVATVATKALKDYYGIG